MRIDPPTLLTPPREEEEIYPYRRVWPSVIIELLILFAVTVVLYILVNFIGYTPRGFLRTLVNVAVMTLPAVLWIFFSRLREGLVPEPRVQLATVFVVSALCANGVGLPLIEALDLDRWLSLGGPTDRLVGYTVTVGIVHETVKYLVLRIIIWPHLIRNRLDVVAYAMASAIGYAVVLNFHIDNFGQILPDVIATRVFANVAFQIGGSLLVAYGIAVTRFSRNILLLMPLTLVLAALVEGVGITFRGNILKPSFVLGIAGSRSLFALVFTVVLIVIVLIVIGFLFSNADRRDRSRSLRGKS